MEDGFLQYLIQQTGAAGIAALTVYYLNKLQAEMIRRNDEYAKKVESFNERLYALLTETVHSIASYDARLSSFEAEIRELRRILGGRRERPE